MTAYESISTLNFHFICRACLRTSKDVVTMTPSETKMYRKLADGKITAKSSNESLKMEYGMKICVICRCILWKIMKFSVQCRKAQVVLNSFVNKKQENSILHPLTSSHNIIQSKTEIYYNVGDSHATINDDKNVMTMTSDHHSDDDETPLVMLKNDDCEIVNSISSPLSKYKTNCHRESMIHYNIDYGDIIPSDVKVEVMLMNDDHHDGDDDQTMSQDDDQTVESDNGVPLSHLTSSQKQSAWQKSTQKLHCHNKRKEMKKGFSSRMVQETEEYVVIKLTEQEVLKEMSERAKSETYLRSPFKCHDCVKGFNFQDVLDTHLKKHSMDHGSFKCEMCSQRCPNAVSLRGHIKSHTTRYKCKICSQVRLSRQHLLEHHALTHTNAPTAYTCEKCDFKSNKRTVIQRHVKSHSTSEGHTCHQCGKLFKTIESLRVHTLRHDNSSLVRCAQCDKRFIYPSLLRKHVAAVHEREDYYCVECDVKFKSAESLRLHFRKAKVHRDASSYTYACGQCSRRFATDSALAVHVSRVHGAPKRQACSACDKRYSSRAALRAHVWRTHGRKNLLKQHQGEHGGDANLIQKEELVVEHTASMEV